MNIPSGPSPSARVRRDATLRLILGLAGLINVTAAVSLAHLLAA